MTRDEATQLLTDYAEELEGHGADSAAQIIRTILSQGYAPPDKVIVPREPTNEMVDAGYKANHDAFKAARAIGKPASESVLAVPAVYRAMLSAADKEQGS